MWPKVSILWLNYNSNKIINLALESIEAVSNLDYPNDKYELIIIDNASTDGSFETISNYVEKLTNLNKKIIRLGKNKGFTGGNNVGFKARDKDSKYVILLNNDAIPFQDSLKIMVEHIENFKSGALNGVILKYGSKNVIDIAGAYLDELLNSFSVGSGEPYPWLLTKPFYVTYASGAYSIYSIDAIKKCLGNKLFIDDLFAYGDDNVIGLMLWDCGYTTITIPTLTAYHFGGASFKQIHDFQFYLSLRNRLALSFVSNSRYKNYIRLSSLKSFVATTTLINRFWKTSFLALRDGIKLGKKLRKIIKPIDIYKAPLIMLDASDILTYTISTRKHYLNKIKEKIKNYQLYQI